MSQTYLGTTRGDFSVDQNGAANYSIPIQIPPGTGGIMPQLALAYVSAGDNDILGMGWQLQGLSRISRVGATVAQDGFHGAVQYDANDRFAMDGVRLVVVGGTYGQSGAVYHTEIESWQQVTPNYDTTPAPDGPDSWTVNTKSGLTLEYGATVPAGSGATAIREWRLSQVTDLHGNYLTIDYDIDAPSSMAYPTTIAYTGNGSLEPGRQVTFTWDKTRTDVLTRYEGGCAIAVAWLLLSIQTSVGGSVVRTYSMTYANGDSTGRSQLTSVTESDGSTPPNSLPPTTFQWQDGNAGIFAAGQAPQLYDSVVLNGSYFAADMDGNGLVDLVNVPSNADGYLEVNLYVSNGEGFASTPVSITTNIPFGSDSAILAMDVDGDGAIELVCSSSSGGDLVLGVVYAEETDGQVTLQFVPGVGPGGISFSDTGRLYSMDVNGDGMLDLVYVTESNGNVALTVLLSTGQIGSGTLFSQLAQPATTTGYYPDGVILTGDFNGDGLDDLVYAYGSGTPETVTLVPFITDPQTFVLAQGSSISTDLPWMCALMPLDVNADGLGDIVHAALDDGKLVVNVLPCQGVQSGSLVFGAAIPSKPFALSALASGIPVLMPADVNGDGLPDFVVASSDGQQVVIDVLIGDGSTFTQQTGVTSPPQSWIGGGPVIPMDYNGDGRTDFVCVGGPATPALEIGVMSAAGVFPDLVNLITNGLGGQFAVSYSPLTDPDVYSAGVETGNGVVPVAALLNTSISGATYGLSTAGSNSPGAAPSSRRVMFPKYVADSHTESDGRGSVYSYSYFYESALMDLNGRGWLGFAVVAATDDNYGAVTKTQYSQTFPWTFVPFVETLTLASDGALMRRVTNTYPPQSNSYGVSMVLQTGSETDYFTFASDQDAAPDCTETRTISYDAFGNPLLIADGGTFWGAPLYTVQTWSNDTSSWLIGFRVQQTIAADLAGTQILRQEQRTYNAEMNVTAVAQWNDQSQQMQTMSYAFDTFGNRISRTDPSGATTQYTYDADYATFLTSRTSPPNAAGASLVWLYQTNPSFGLASSQTDPNGVIAMQSFDGLGRVIQHSGPTPDGTTAVLSNMIWAVDGDGLYGETQILSDWSSGSMRWSRHYIDGLGRVWRNATLGPDGQTPVNVDKTFQSDGQELTITLPYYDQPGASPQAALLTYDPFRRLTQKQVPQGEAMVTTAFSYPAYNQQIRVENAGGNGGRTTTSQLAKFQSRQRIVSQTGNDGQTTTWTFDPLGEVTSITDPLGVVTSASYDTLGRGIGSAVQSGESTQMGVATSYDDLARTMSNLDARGTQIVTTFDALLRPVMRSVQMENGSNVLTTLTYDEASSSYSQNRVSSVAMSNGSSYLYAYDATGSQTGIELTTGDQSWSFSRSYNPAGQIETITYPDSSLQVNIYNLASQLTTITLTPPGGEAQSMLSVGAFSPFGMSGMRTSGNGVVAAFGYDATGMLNTRTLNGPGGAVIDSVTYTFNGYREVVALQDDLTAGNSQSFTYDPVGRLSQAGGSYPEQTYGFDASGNLNLKNTVNYTIEGYQVNEGSDGFSASYDPNGNVVTAVRASGTTNYQYDGDNQLISAGAGAVTMSYDYAGRRLTKTIADGASPTSSPTTTIYVTPFYEVTSFPDGSRQHTIFVTNGADVIASVTTVEAGAPPPTPGVPVPGTYYLHQDHLHSTIFQTDSEGNVTASLTYLPDGQILTAGQPDTVRHKYTGKEWDADLGLYYFGARYYDPVLSRFLTADDRLGGPPGGRDILVRYAFAGNDPINNFDPTGHAWWQWVVAAVVVAAGIGLAVVALSTGNVVLASTLAGAALGGLQYEITAAVAKGQNFSWDDFGTQIGIGAATGLVAGGVASAGSIVLGRLAGVGADAAEAALTGLRAGVKTATSIISGVATSVTNQTLEDAAHHVNMTTGLATAAAVGFVAGLIGAGIADKVSESLAQPVDEFGFIRSSESMALLGDQTVGYRLALTFFEKVAIAAPPAIFGGIGGLARKFLPQYP